MAKLTTILGSVLFALIVTVGLHFLAQQVNTAVTPHTETPAQAQAEAKAAAGIKTPPPR